MYCTKCGAVNDDDAGFCATCGEGIGRTPTKIDNQITMNDVLSEYANFKKKKNKTALLISGAVLLVGIIVFVVVFILNTRPEVKAKKQLALAGQYLEEMQYDMAIASYMQAIEIDAKNVDAYAGIADAYTSQGKIDEAIDILVEGYINTDAEELLDRLEENVDAVIDAYLQRNDYEGAISYIEEIESQLDTAFMTSRKQELIDKLEEIKAEEQKVNEEEEFRAQIERALVGNTDHYIREFFALDEYPEKYVEWINKAQTTDPGDLPHDVPVTLLPEEWILNNWTDGYDLAAQYEAELYGMVMSFATKEHMNAEYYFVTGREANYDYRYPITYRDGNIYYPYIMGGWGWMGGKAELHDPRIIEIDGDVCHVTYVADVFGFDYESRDGYYHKYTCNITFTLIKDPASLIDGLRITHAEISY